MVDPLSSGLHNISWQVARLNEAAFHKSQTGSQCQVVDGNLGESVIESFLLQI